MIKQKRWLLPHSPCSGLWL